jgi:hypothetical protein
MRTDDLIAMLSADVEPVEANAVARRYAVALGWGAFGATLLMAVLFGVRPDLHSAVRLSMFWVKLAFPAAIAVGGLLVVARLSRPGMPLGRSPVAIAVPVVAIALLAIVALVGATPGERAALLRGSTLRYCLETIPLLSLPVLAAVTWAMKGLAPTRLALAGGAAGLFAGAVGALVYSLHCPEMAAPFIAAWYSAGMLVPAAAGALLGPLVLRW